jgi:hypothetical protein
MILLYRLRVKIFLVNGWLGLFLIHWLMTLTTEPAKLSQNGGNKQVRQDGKQRTDDSKDSRAHQSAMCLVNYSYLVTD